MTPRTDVTTIYGCSDDLIELDGAVYDEFDAYGRDSRLKFDALAVLRDLPTASVDAVITDPPYYDNVPYADISDFF